MNWKVFLLVCLVLIPSDTIRSPVISSPALPPLLWKGTVNGTVLGFEMPVDSILPVHTSRISALDMKTGDLLWDSAWTGWSGYCSDFETDAGVLFAGQGPLAIDPETGDILWAREVRKVGTYHAVGYGKLFVTEYDSCTFGSYYSDRTSIMAFDEFTGDHLWTFDAHSVIVSDIELGSGLVVFGCEDGTVFALDHTTGDVVWTAKTGGAVRLKPVVAESCVFISSDVLYCVDLETGELRWTVENEGGADSTMTWGLPVVTQGKVLSPSGTLHCIDMDTGSVLWKKFSYPFAVSDKSVYAFTGSGYACLNIEDSTVLWTYEREGVDFGEVVVHNEEVILTFSTTILVLDASTGEEKWNYDVSEPISCPPLVLDTFIAIGTEEAHVIALGTPGPGPSPRCGELESAKRLLFKKDYENALKMLEDVRVSCPGDVYLEIDTLIGYAHTQQKKADWVTILTVVGVALIVASTCGVVARKLKRR